MCVIVTSQADTMPSLTQLARMSDANPDGAEGGFLSCLNPDSLETLEGCKVEAGLASAAAPQSFQFLRQGYFAVDSKDSRPGALVFNRAVALKDSFKK